MTTPQPSANAAVHQTAIIDPAAEVHPSVQIGPYCVVGADVRIGEGTVLKSHVCVNGPTVVGRGNVVYPYAVLGAEPQDLKFQGERSQLVIGDENHIREHVTVHRGTAAGGGSTRVGSRCLLMVGAHVAHDCIISDEVVIANGVLLGGHCEVEFGATLAGGVGVHHFTTIGELAFVGGMARISKDVPPYLVVEGAPAEPRKVNTTALSRRGWDAHEIEAVRAVFKRLYRNSDETCQAVIEALRSDPGQPPAVRRLCDSVDRAQGGVHGRFLETQRSGMAPRYGTNGTAGGTATDVHNNSRD